MDKGEEQHAYVLLYYNLENPTTTLQPEVILFDSPAKLKQHVADLIIRKIDKFDEYHRPVMLQLGKNKMFENLFNLWRHLEKEGSCFTGFDVHWDDKPQAVL